MILSHKHRFIFIKTVKVGGTSLEITLSKYCGPDDIITPIAPTDEKIRKALGFRGAQNHEPRMVLSRFIPDLLLPKNLRTSVVEFGKYYNHISAEDLKNMIPKDTWDTYFKFTIIRNPYDRIVSHYFWANRLNPERQDFRTWLLKTKYAARFSQKLYLVNGKPCVDFFVRFENFEEDLAFVSKTIGLEENMFDVMKTQSAKTGIRDARLSTEEYFDGFDEGKRLVEDFAAIEFDIGGYKKL